MARSDTSPAIHNIGLFGLTGLIFVVLTCALVFYLEGFVTTAWSVSLSTHDGLWHSCNQTTSLSALGSGWLLSVQIFSCLGLVGLVVSFGLATIYMSGNRVSKNLTIVSLAVMSLLTGILLLVTVIVYGLHAQNTTLSWSYYVSLASAVLCLLAGLLALLQTRKSNVRF